MKYAALQRYAGVAERAAAGMQAELRVHAPHRTYKLRQSIKVTSHRQSPYVFRITAETGDLVQARTTNTGARPHVIRARRAKTLRFYWAKVGKVVTPISVRHPGNKGTRWWDRTIKRHTSIIRAALRS